MVTVKSAERELSSILTQWQRVYKYHGDKIGHFSIYLYKTGSDCTSTVFLPVKHKFKLRKVAKIVVGFYGTKQELPRRKKFCVFYHWKCRFQFFISILKLICLYWIFKLYCVICISVFNIKLFYRKAFLEATGFQIYPIRAKGFN